MKSPPVMHKANKRAWMTGELFEEWVVAFDKNMKPMKKRSSSSSEYLREQSGHPYHDRSHSASSKTCRRPITRRYLR